MKNYQSAGFFWKAIHICTKVRRLSLSFCILFYCSVVRTFTKQPPHRTGAVPNISRGAEDASTISKLNRTACGRECGRLCTFHEAENARLLFGKQSKSRMVAIKYFCAGLEGAYTIEKTIDTLHDCVSQFNTQNRWVTKHTFRGSYQDTWL